jgi:hypothetical protein
MERLKLIAIMMKIVFHRLIILCNNANTHARIFETVTWQLLNSVWDYV